MATSLKLTDELRNKVQHIAGLKNRTAHWIMCEAIRNYTETELAKESFKQEALSSWENYQETKLHLTGDEVQNWLSTWGTDNEQETPKCHE